MGKPPLKRRSFFKVMIGDFRTKLRIPPSFKKHLSKLGSRSDLRSPRGGPWRVEVGRAAGGWSFGKGWEAFVADHTLALGDFLVFLYDGGLGFDVMIYGKSGCEKEAAEPPGCKKGAGTGNPRETIITCLPANPRNPRNPAATIAEGKNPFLLRKTSSGGFWVTRPSRNKVERERVLEAACSYNTTNPHFVATLSKSRRNHMTIPRALVREHDLAENKSMILQDPVGSSWHVKLVCRRDGRVELGTGWSEFRRGNWLEEGDACVFEFVWEGIIHVHIFRVKEDTKELVGKSGVEEGITQLVRKSGLCDAGGSTQSDMRPATSKDKERVLEIANSFETRHSKFVAFCRSYRLHDLSIPAFLVREHNLKMKRNTVLHDPIGRPWPVKFSHRRDGRVSLGSGWMQFSRGNRLRDGDACVLEFVDGAKAIRVHIFRVEGSDGSAGSVVEGQNSMISSASSSS